MTNRKKGNKAHGEWKIELVRIQALMDKGRFRQAIPVVSQFLQRYPDNVIPYILLSTCQSEIGNSNEALATLQEGEKQFPDHFDLLYHIAETFIELKDYEKAEKYFRRSLDSTPTKLREEMSGCCVGLGVSLWEQHRRSDALAMWRMALKFDPDNEVAKRNLAELTNQFNEPAAPSKIFDDLYHFQNIHKERYLNQCGRKEFTAIREAEKVMEAIRIAWNTRIAPLGNKVDAMTPAEKTALFRSVEFDFE